MNYTTEVLTEMLGAHSKWLRGEEGGKRFAPGWGANLTDANLTDANLTRANLTRANLTRANLMDADLMRANLMRANLTDANLTRANLMDADLMRANLTNFNWAVCPEEGAFVGWKRVRGGHILKLEILADAQRVSTPLGRKCRASSVRVLEAQLVDGAPTLLAEFASGHDPAFKYRVGEIATVSDFDASINVECTRGIHFWITRKEAVEWLIL